MTELVLVVLLAASGWLLASPIWGSPVWRTVLALPVGTGLYVTAMTLVLALRIPAPPRVVLVVVTVGSVLVAWRRRPPIRPVAWRWPLLGLLVIAVVVAVTHAVPVVNVTADSFRYLTTASILAVDAGLERTSTSLLLARQLATGAVHALAPLDPGYLRAVGPLVGISTVATIGYAAFVGTSRLDPAHRRWVAVGAAALLATNHRFIFSSLYVNGHVLFAAWITVIAVLAWRAAADASRADWSAAVAVVACAVGIAVVRPEGAFIAALALLPLLVNGQLGVRWRTAVLIAVGAGTLAWHGVVVVGYAAARGQQVTVEMLGIAVTGLALVAAAAAVPLVDRLPTRRALGVVAVGLWAVLAAAALLQPDVAMLTARPTLRNVFLDGIWGASLVLLAALLLAVYAVRRVRQEAPIVFTIASFVPLVTLTGFLRGSGFRVGPGDSLNRMLIHVVPLAVLALALAADSEPRAWPPWLRRVTRPLGRRLPAA